jgi:hypothetical protein
MSVILFSAWAFSVVSFCVVGVACRVLCRRRRGRGASCICGRHPAPEVGPGSTPQRRLSPLASGPARLRAAEARVRSLQRRYVEGRLSMEQYETEVDRAVGLA